MFLSHNRLCTEEMHLCHLAATPLLAPLGCLRVFLEAHTFWGYPFFYVFLLDLKASNIISFHKSSQSYRPQGAKGFRDYIHALGVVVVIPSSFLIRLASSGRSFSRLISLASSACSFAERHCLEQQ